MRPPQRYLLPIEDPEVPDGWRTGPPDVVGVGAQRAGTTWWWRGAIRSHPGFVREAKPRKEVHFFDRFWTEEVPGDLADRYARLFPRPEGAITGEWTPRYMHDYWVPPLLARAAPAARILVMLRDPVERYRSGLAREQRIAAEHDAPLEIAIVGDAVYRSMYAGQLERLFELYPRERVLILQHERCSADPFGEMQRTQRFLGLEPLTEMPELLVREHKPSQNKRELPAALAGELAGRLAEDAWRTAALCPEIDLALWPSVSEPK
jgi:Sulfotransferase domain